MRPRLTLVCHLFCLGSIRCVSLLVPGHQREEWWREWRSELWHVREACTPERGISWAAEREVARFCLGAFQDALCLRRHAAPRRMPHATTMGSAMQCILLLAGLAATSYGITLLLPGVSAILHSPHYRDVQNLMLIRDAHYSGDSIPTISTEQYRLWNLRRQEIFDGFSYYRVAYESVLNARNVKAVRGIAIASPNLFTLLGLPIRFASGEVQGEMPQLILSNEMWKSEFGGDPHISGRVVRVGQREAIVGGVAPAESWRLPGKVDAWLLEPDAASIADGMGFVVAHLRASPLHARWGASWHMSAPKPDGSLDDFFCVSLTERTRGCGDVFLFAVLLACLALPATTSLPLGEYRLSSRKLSWPKRLRRWCFLGSKIALLLPIVYDPRSVFLRVHPTCLFVLDLPVWPPLGFARSAPEVPGLSRKTDTPGASRSAIQNIPGLERNGADMCKRTRSAPRPRNADKLVQHAAMALSRFLVGGFVRGARPRLR
jgi:hypothetical protein